MEASEADFFTMKPAVKTKEGRDSISVKSQLLRHKIPSQLTARSRSQSEYVHDLQRFRGASEAVFGFSNNLGLLMQILWRSSV